ncbi:DUF2321 domain-containing protein [Robinsoniella peoriensis]
MKGIRIMSYYGATICLNGHVISKRKANFQKYCLKCGKETYSNCLRCNAPINGLIEIKGAVVAGDRFYERPFYCYECGSPYPWTEKILNDAVELLSLDDNLEPSIKELIKSAIPDLIVDTPSTPLAIAKYNKGISKAGQIIKDSMYSLLIDVISEATKKALFS